LQFPEGQTDKYFYVSLGNNFLLFFVKALSFGGPWATAQFAPPPLNPALCWREAELGVHAMVAVSDTTGEYRETICCAACNTVTLPRAV